MAKTLTPNYSFGKWDDGDNPGATDLNANWTSIDLNMRKTDLMQQTLDAENEVLMAAAGTTNMANVLLQKDFFTAQGLMPANKIREDLYTLTAPTFQQLNGGTLTTNMSATKYISGGAVNNAQFGWSLVNSYRKVLLIVGMTRVRQNAGGIFIGTSVPVGNDPPAGYLGMLDNLGSRTLLTRPDGAGTNTNIATDATIVPQDDYKQHDVSMALYVNGSRVIYFLRQGYSTWYPVCDVADATSTLFNSVGIHMYQNADTYWFGCPIGIYAE